MVHYNNCEKRKQKKLYFKLFEKLIIKITRKNNYPNKNYFKPKHKLFKTFIFMLMLQK